MTSSQYGPYAWGRTRATMAGTEGRETARWSKPQRAGPFASNGASAVGAVNTFPGLVHTARHIMKAVCTRSRWPIRKGGAV